MCRNKFWIGGLIGVHVSSIVNEVIRTILSLFIFFYRKILSAQKLKSNQNQQTKQKQANKKQQKQRFSVQKNLTGKIGYFAFLKKN